MSPGFFQILICKWPTIFSFIDEKNDFGYSMLKCSIFYKVKSLISTNNVLSLAILAKTSISALISLITLMCVISMTLKNKEHHCLL